MPPSAGSFARSGPAYSLLHTSRTAANRRLRPTCRHLHGRTVPREQTPWTKLEGTKLQAIQRRYASTAKPSEDNEGRIPPPSENEIPQTRHAEPMAGEAGSSEGKARKDERKYYGSYRRRAARGAQEIRLNVPEWFLTRNIRLSEESNPDSPRLEVVDERSDHETKIETSQKPRTDHGAQREATEAGQLQEQRRENGAIYQIDKNIFDEISFMMLGGLRASSTSATEDSLNSRSHILLQSPQPGGEIFLDTVVAQAARTRHLDLLTLDPQDIADIAAEAPEAFPENSLTSVRRLGFDTYVFEDDQYPESAEESGADQEGMEDSYDASPEDRPKSGSFHIPGMSASAVKPIHHMIQVLIPSNNRGRGSPTYLKRPFNNASPGFPNFFTASSKPEDPYVSPENDSTAFIRKFLDAPQLKRDQQRWGSLAATEHEDSDKRPHGLIVHIKDYLELSATGIGGAVLDKIHSVIDSKRRDGRPILIVGSSSSADLVPSLSESSFNAMQAGSEGDKFRTIVTTCMTPDVEPIFVEDAKFRTAQINCRNILATLRELYPEPSQLDASLSEPNFGLTPEQMFQFDLAEEVWPLERVQRMASIASGMLEIGEPMSGRILSHGLGVMDVSDKAKFEWVTQELQRLEPPSGHVFKTQEKEKQEEKRKSILKSCNRYEKKLMNGVVDAQKIKTTFSDVHVPPGTIEALKTLTSLSLVRPDAFTYGVLATDKIPGLLLYGPPGTGKTMLAKAVAKESGATVLEVAGSDVYDMYVGEGEKNVRAIFTLARKLSPCVVFIDEADAIFGSRSGSHNRKSHRELINQFLREWDGMNDLSAFIMVATNRPFDLDDAVLRRLPRRLLVDLPTDTDREAILGIHLKDEVLASDVSLSDLANKTPFYSGSDLKNLSVAAALACVREENEDAAKHTGGEAYKYPEKRTLRYEHFDKAMAEISASVSEDMSSLSAIRKFDERYGDRKGRRKRSGGLGFGTKTGKDMDREKREDGRVRNSEVALE